MFLSRKLAPAAAATKALLPNTSSWTAKLSSSTSQVHSPCGNTLTEFLVCPLSKQPLRYCEESNSLISDAIGVSFPVKNGIPCLVPRDGKILEEEQEDTSKPDNDTN